MKNRCLSRMVSLAICLTTGSGASSFNAGALPAMTLRELSPDQSEPVRQALRAGLEESGKLIILHPDDLHGSVLYRSLFSPRTMANPATRRMEFLQAFLSGFEGYLRSLPPSGVALVLGLVPETASQMGELETLGLRPWVDPGEVWQQLKSSRMWPPAAVTDREIVFHLHQPLIVAEGLPPLEAVHLVPSETAGAETFAGASHLSTPLKGLIGTVRQLMQEQESLSGKGREMEKERRQISKELSAMDPQKFYGQLDSPFQQGRLVLIGIPYGLTSPGDRDAFSKNLPDVFQEGRSSAPLFLTLSEAEARIQEEGRARYAARKKRLIQELTGHPKVADVRPPLRKALQRRVESLIQPDPAGWKRLSDRIDRLVPDRIAESHFFPSDSAEGALGIVLKRLEEEREKLAGEIQRLPEQGGLVAEHLDIFRTALRGRNWNSLGWIPAAIAALADRFSRSGDVPTSKELEKLFVIVRQVRALLRDPERNGLNLQARDFLRQWEMEAVGLLARCNAFRNHPVEGRKFLMEFLADPELQEGSFWNRLFQQMGTEITDHLLIWAPWLPREKFSKEQRLVVLRQEAGDIAFAQRQLVDIKGKGSSEGPADLRVNSVLEAYQAVSSQVQNQIVPMELKVDFLMGSPAAAENLKAVSILLWACVYRMLGFQTLAAVHADSARERLDKSHLLDPRYPLWKLRLEPDPEIPITAHIDRMHKAMEAKDWPRLEELSSGLADLALRRVREQGSFPPDTLYQLDKIFGESRDLLSREKVLPPDVQSALRVWQAQTIGTLAVLSKALPAGAGSRYFSDPKTLDGALWLFLDRWIQEDAPLPAGWDRELFGRAVEALLLFTPNAPQARALAAFRKRTGEIVSADALPAINFQDNQIAAAFQAAQKRVLSPLGPIPPTLKKDLLQGHRAAAENLAGWLDMVIGNAAFHLGRRDISDRLDGAQDRLLMGSRRSDPRYPLWPRLPENAVIVSPGLVEERLEGSLSMMTIHLQTDNWLGVEQESKIILTTWPLLLQHIQDGKAAALRPQMVTMARETAFRIGQVFHQGMGMPPELYGSLHRIQAMALLYLAQTGQLSETGEQADQSRAAVNYFVQDPTAYQGDVWLALSRFWKRNLGHFSDAVTLKDVDPERIGISTHFQGYRCLFLTSRQEQFSFSLSSREPDSADNFRTTFSLLQKHRGKPMGLTPLQIREAEESVLEKIRIPSEYKAKALLEDPATLLNLLLVDVSRIGKVAEMLGHQEIARTWDKGLKSALGDLIAEYPGHPLWWPWPEDLTGLEEQVREDVADDATGGAELSLEVAKAGSSALLVTSRTDPTLLKNYSVIIRNVQTRNLRAGPTVQRIRKLETAPLGHGEWSYLKIDSTLRGNWLEGLVARAKRITPGLIILAPAVLSQKRVTRQGIHGLLQDGRFVPLHETMYRDLIDPQLAEVGSDLKAYLMKRRVGLVELLDSGTIEKGPEEVRARLVALKMGTYVVVDAVEERHLQILAESVKSMGRPALCCGSAGFYSALISKNQPTGLKPWSNQFRTNKVGTGKVLVIAGSHHSVSEEQVRTALRQLPGRVVLLEVRNGNLSSMRALKNKVREVQAGIRKAWRSAQTVVVRIEPPPIVKPNSPSQVSLGEFYRDLIDGSETGGELSLLIVFGGDTLDAVLRGLSAGFVARGEVAPQVSYGELIRPGGSRLPIVTKSGGFGDRDLLKKILRTVGKPCIGITLGDPTGSGPELLLRALAGHPELMEGSDLFVIGDGRILSMAQDFFRDRYPLIQKLTIHSIRRLEEAQFVPGILNVLDLQNVNTDLLKRSIESLSTEIFSDLTRRHFGQAALSYLDVGIELASTGQLDGLVTLPVTKEDIARVSPGFRGHTEYLGEHLGTVTGSGVVSIVLIHGGLRVLHVTMHNSLKEVVEVFQNPQVTDRIVELIRIADQMGRRYFGLQRPRIGVLGLNPHSGEGGLLGKEDQGRIQPAIARALTEGLNVAPNPIPGDTAFTPGVRDRYDFLIAMYHDQGHGPFKAIAGFSGINFTGNLNIVRTTPDHGPARQQAWQPELRPPLSPEGALSSIRSAIEMVLAERNFSGLEELPSPVIEAFRMDPEAASVWSVVPTGQEQIPQPVLALRFPLEAVPVQEKISPPVVFIQKGVVPATVIAHFQKRGWKVELLPSDLREPMLLAEVNAGLKEWEGPLFLVVDAGLEESIRKLPPYGRVTIVVLNRDLAHRVSGDLLFEYLEQISIQFPGHFFEPTSFIQTGLEEATVLSDQL